MFLRSALIGVLGFFTLALTPVHAGDDWQTMMFVSDTLGNNVGRLCAGAPATFKPGDIGCPTYAPSLTTAGDVSVTGNLSAAKFIGDGSALTGLSTSTDRITSGTSSVIVNSATSTISFTTAGSERMVISSTGDIRFLSTNDPNLVIGTDGQNLVMTQNNFWGWHTGLKFTSSKGIQFYSTGTPTNYYLPTDFSLSGSNMRIGNVMIGGYSVALPGSSSNNGTSSFALLTTTQGAAGWGGATYAPTLFIRPGDGVDSNRNGGHVFISGGKADGTGQDGNVVVGYDVSRSSAYGRVGIANASPRAKLDVIGTISASDIVQVGSTTTIACGSSYYGSIRYTNVSDTLQICTSGGWKSLVSGTATATATGLEDRITSGTSSVIVNSATSTISFTTAGSQRMVIDGSGNVGVGTTAPAAVLDVSTTDRVRLINGSDYINLYPSLSGSPTIQLFNAGIVDLRLIATDTGLSVGSPSVFATLTATVSSFGTKVQSPILEAMDGTNPYVRIWKNGVQYFDFNAGTAGRLDLLNTSARPLMSFLSTGNVGIGTSAPNQTLDVSGSANISGTVMIGSDTTISGTVKISSRGGEACNSTNYGTIRFNPTTGVPEMCRR